MFAGTSTEQVRRHFSEEAPHQQGPRARLLRLRRLGPRQGKQSRNQRELVAVCRPVSLSRVCSAARREQQQHDDDGDCPGHRAPPQAQAAGTELQSQGNKQGKKTMLSRNLCYISLLLLLLVSRGSDGCVTLFFFFLVVSDEMKRTAYHQLPPRRPACTSE